MVLDFVLSKLELEPKSNPNRSLMLITDCGLLAVAGSSLSIDEVVVDPQTLESMMLKATKLNTRRRSTEAEVAGALQSIAKHTNELKNFTDNAMSRMASMDSEKLSLYSRQADKGKNEPNDLASTSADFADPMNDTATSTLSL
jgi:hypothetical protein